MSVKITAVGARTFTIVADEATARNLRALLIAAIGPEAKPDLAIIDHLGDELDDFREALTEALGDDTFTEYDQLRVKFEGSSGAEDEE